MERRPVARIDRLVVRELFGPWVFGVAMFTALLIAATYLSRIASYIVDGLPAGLILRFTGLMLPGILVQTFAMSMLLAGLLAFGRLSGDSEIVALRAAGASLHRILRPVAMFAIAVALVAFFLNETVVPQAGRESLLLQSQIAKRIDPNALRPTSYPIVDQGKVVAMVSARNFDMRARVLRGATIITYDEQGRNALYLEAKELEFDPKAFAQGQGWRIRGGARLVTADGVDVATIDDEAWPPGVPKPTFSPEDLITSQVRDLAIFSMSEMREQIETERKNPNANPSQVRNLEYQFWNKIALPLAAFIFGTLGATLGIRSHRTGTASGFALAVAIIFAYFMIANFMNVWAMGGVIPPWAASFSPIAIGLAATGVLIWRRNL